MTRRARDEGYAMLAAVGAIAVFATLALAMLGHVQAAVLATGAEVERAKADAAADAGAQLAIRNLIGADRAFRWRADGRPYPLQFAGNRIVVRMYDQRGRLPLAVIDEEQVRRLFTLLDVPPARLEEVTDSYLDWTDDDDEPRPNGAELAYYAARGLYPRNATPETIDELALVRGFDRALVERVRAVATVHFSGGSFEPRLADPIAIAAFSEAGENSPEVIDRRRELAGQRTAIDIDEVDPPSRSVELAVEATTPGGGRSRLRQMILLTGTPERPYSILESD